MSSVVPSFDYPRGSGAALNTSRTPVVSPDRLVSQPAVIAAVLLYDAVVILLTGAVGWLYATTGSSEPAPALVPTLLCVSASFLAILGLRWAYTIRALSSLARSCGELLLALCLAFAGLIVVSALLGAFTSLQKNWLFYWLLSAWSCTAAARYILADQLAQWTKEGRLARRAVIVGGGESSAELLRQLGSAGDGAIQILGLFDDRDDEQRSPQNVEGYAKLGRFDDLVEFCRAQRVDLLIVALPPTAEERILQILKKLWVLPIDVRVAALGSRLKLRARAYSYIGDAPFLPLFDKPMSDWSVAVKDIQDRVLACLAILVLSPLLALIALAIKLDSRGPVLFKQTRYGFNNEPIAVFKFRSMYVDQTDAHGARQVQRQDPRVTRVGRFIRRTSLDELPQLFNVAFLGNLALVGPRPHALQSKAADRLYDEVVDGYFARHRVKPGITGWAQINGWRGETDTVEKIEQRVAHDLYYIDNWSMLLDMRILLLTPFCLASGTNAY
jgi:Undecaprenyl-phosphate glucose phosphotransferase